MDPQEHFPVSDEHLYGPILDRKVPCWLPQCSPYGKLDVTPNNHLP
jgi:hypothetical protein